ncbi:MAG: hypothetical protein FWD25_09270 [Clostridia bacterium]|nr:hypothetical protein [Clostridia bacterium]
MKNKPNKSRWVQILILLVALLLLALNYIGESPLHWGNINTLQDHFDRHGPAFDAMDAEDYARQAHAFYLNREQHQVKTDTDGTVRIYDATTNAFGAYNADGTTRTYFKPSNGQAYFDRQPGHKGE